MTQPFAQPESLPRESPGAANYLGSGDAATLPARATTAG